MGRLMMVPFVCLAAALLGGLIAWLVASSVAAGLRARLALREKELEETLDELRKERAKIPEFSGQVASLQSMLDSERRTSEEKLRLLTRAGDELREGFKALAADALQSNNQQFLELARTSLERFQTEAKGDLEARKQAVETLVAPIRESLEKVDCQVRSLEQARSQAYGELKNQVQSLIQTQETLRSETGNLVRALRAPAVRGRWGEIQLRRVVEIAGMLSYCDFLEQETVTTDSGRIRPDLIVKLPGGKSVVVDAKTPLQAYLEAAECTNDETRRAKMLEHSRQVRTHMARLSSKSYWEQFENTPEFVVMFLPGETFFSAALEQDPSLIEEGVSQRVLPASPTTLIALLRAVAYGWRQETIARNAQDISALGKELHDRLRTLASHIEAVGKGLDRAVESYNKAVGSLEQRVMVSARKFAELGAPVTEEIAELEPIDTTARTLQFEWSEEEESEPEKAKGEGAA
jgi:DNA recombination protein RmuC